MCVQKHGHVWKANVLGTAMYGLAGDEGLKAFYDEKNVARFPGMSDNLKQAAWVLNVRLGPLLTCHLPLSPVSSRSMP